MQIKRIINPRMPGNINQPENHHFEVWARVIHVRFIEEARTTTDRITKVIGSS